MKYKGIELVEVTEPQLFDPPKKMFVWDNDNEYPYKANVCAIVNRNNFRAITETSDWRHCAEIPKLNRPVGQRKIKMAKTNYELKKATTLAKKLIVERDRILKSSDKIQSLLLNTDFVIGGYKMVQTLRKQKSIFDELADLMNKRIELFKNVANSVTEENFKNVVETK